MMPSWRGSLCVCLENGGREDANVIDFGRVYVCKKCGTKVDAFLAETTWEMRKAEVAAFAGVNGEKKE